MTWEEWVTLAKHWREQGDAIALLLAPVLIAGGLVILAVVYWQERKKKDAE